MTVGPGKYDAAATAARKATGATDGVVLIVFGGKHGSGFSVQATADITAGLPALLRNLADKVENELRNPENWP
jgi:hypothetical protein